MIERFLVGNSYIRPGLYGPSFWVTCVARTSVVATFAPAGYEADKESWVEIPIEIINGSEVCLCWESQGTVAYINTNVEY